MKETTVEAHLEGAPAGVDELDLQVFIPTSQGIRQTDGSGPVVSEDAVLDLYLHCGLVDGEAMNVDGLNIEPARGVSQRSRR